MIKKSVWYYIFLFSSNIYIYIKWIHAYWKLINDMTKYTRSFVQTNRNLREWPYLLWHGEGNKDDNDANLVVIVHAII